MEYIQYILPVVLLLMAFLLKLLIDQTATLPLFLRAIVEFPVDVAFLATSFTAAFTLSRTAEQNAGLLYFCAFLIGTILIVFCWRRAIRLFEAGRYWSMFFLSSFNYGVAITGLVLAIGMLCGGE